MSEPVVEAPKELREARDRAVERAEAAEKAAQAAISELRQFKAEVTFQEAGLTPKHAELFLTANPEAEVTAQAITDFAAEYGLVPAQSNDPAPSNEPQPNPDRQAAAIGGAAGSQMAGAAPAAQPKMSAGDFEKLLAENPQAAAEAYVKGLVERNERNVQANDLVRKGIIDH
jgi:hypothetical protein